MAYQVYRIYDADKNLLYVGCSLNPINRLMGHKQKKPWFNQIKTIDICNFSSKRLAMEAELHAIQNENPIHNLSGSKDWAEKRLRRYEAAKNMLSMDWIKFNQNEHEYFYPALNILMKEGIAERGNGENAGYLSYRLTQAASQRMK